MKGKSDRGALNRMALDPDSTQRLPKSQAKFEDAIRDIWQEVLGIEGIRPTDNFLELGGDCLRAVQVGFRFNEKFDVEIPIAMLLGMACLSEIARELATQHSGQGGL